MHHVMLDLETLGKTSNAAIVCIGACFFDPYTKKIGSSIYLPISLESSLAAGLEMDASTVMWWLKQSDKARAALTKGEKIPLFDAIGYFSEWIGQFDNHSDLQVWGNGCGFDNVVLKNAFSVFDMDMPWKFWQDRDVRTIVEIGEMAGIDAKNTISFKGVRHNALDDAIHQAIYVSEIFCQLGIVNTDKSVPLTDITPMPAKSVIHKRN